MNRFVRAAGCGALVWLGLEAVLWAGEKTWDALKPKRGPFDGYLGADKPEPRETPRERRPSTSKKARA